MLIRYLIFLSVVVLCAAGCGSSTPTGGIDMGGPDANQIATLIEDMNDAKGDARKTAAALAKGTTLSDAKRFAQHEYYIVGQPTVNGDQATCKVRVDGSGGNTVGEVEWEFVKEGDKWKIKSAPLP